MVGFEPTFFRPSGSSGKQVDLLRGSVPVSGGEQEMEEPLPLRPRLLQHPLLREQSGERTFYSALVLPPDSNRRQLF